jgi:aminoglycoside/choline kinase family phosphotransferase
MEIEKIKEILLNQSHLNCSLMNLNLLAGDASSRKYYRLTCNNNQYITCIDNTQDAGINKNFLEKQKYLKEQGIHVPAIIFHLDNILVQEDLGDETLLQKLSIIDSLEEEKKIYQDVVDNLVELHNIKIDSAQDVVTLFFDQEKLMQEIQMTTQYFLRFFLKSSESDIQAVEKYFDEIVSQIVSKKNVFTHRDFHSRNILFKNNQFVMIDFQDARWGIPQYDLASLLHDCYYNLDSENTEYLINYYYTKRKNYLSDYKDYSEFRYFYDLMAIQRVFKAIGSFAYIYQTRGDIRYIKYIGQSMEKLKILLYRENFIDLRKVLFKNFYAN